MGDFWEGIRTGLGPGLKRAYGPIIGGLEQGTKTVFGPKARFFPESWGLGAEQPAAISDLDGMAAGQRLGGNPLAEVFSDEGSGQSTGLPPRAPESRAKDLNLSSVLDLSSLKRDMQAAAAGDQAAKSRVQGLKDSPAVTSLGEPKAKSRPGMGQLPSARDLTSEGLSPAALPAGRDLSGEGMMLSSLPAPREVGGGGVEVPEQEKSSRNPMGLGIIGDTLINVGNALSDARPIATGGYHDQLMDQLRQEQMSQLKMRHDMWSDAYSQSQKLPAEVMALPEFASLAQAKQALEIDLLKDGKVDNEKNVSNFLTEMSRHKSKLEQLLATSQGQQTAAAEEATLTARGNRRAELEAAAAQGNPQAQATLAMLGPSAQQKFEAEEAERAANHEYRLSALAQQGADRDEDRALRQANMGLLAQSRGDALDFRRKQSAASGLNAMMRETLKLYGKADEDGNLTNPEEAVNQMFKIHGDDIIAAGEALGLRIQKAGDATNPLLVVNGRPMNARQGHSYILAQIRTAGGE